MKNLTLITGLLAALALALPAGAANAAVVSLDGTDDYMSFGGTGVPTGNAVFSVEAWINTDTADKPGANEGQIVYFWGNESSDNSHGLVLKDATHSAVPDQVNFFVWAQPNATLTQTTTDLANPTGGPNGDGWRYLAVTYDGSLRTIYVDGALEDSVADTSMTIAAANYMIGKRPGGEAFDGLIDEVRIWNKALSAGEIAAQWNQKLTGSESGLVAYFDFENGTTDVAGGNNTGTLFNGASIDLNSNAPLVFEAATIPEPASLAVWALGALGLVWYRRGGRRR